MDGDEGDEGLDNRAVHIVATLADGDGHLAIESCGREK